MERDQDAPAQTKRPPATDEATSRTAVPLPQKPPPEPRPAARPWSARRIPAAITALIIGAAAGLLLFDVIRVRAGSPAAAWRRRSADELATRPLDDTFVQTGAGVIAALGLWLIILALTPVCVASCPCRHPARECMPCWTAMLRNSVFGMPRCMSRASAPPRSSSLNTA